MTTIARIPSVKELLNQLLDQGYDDAVASVIQAIARNGTTGLLAERLAQFRAEAARLAEMDSKWSATNPVFKALLDELDYVMRRNAALLDTAVLDIQTAAINAANQITRQLALPGLSDAMLAAIGVQWNVPSAEAVARLVQYTATDAWRELLSAYADDIVLAIRDVVLSGMVEGLGPVAVARQVAELADGLPAYQAQAMLRTLFLSSFRDATVADELANADIIEKVIRLETLDLDTCGPCWFEHGAELEIGEHLDEHWNGRAVPLIVVKGFDRQVQPGIEQFGALSEARQRDILGDAGFAAWQAGDVRLEDFTHHYVDDVFGGMLREASLKGLLGDGAKRFYGGQNG